MGVGPGPEGRVALGDERAAVEQGTGLDDGARVDRYGDGSGGLEQCDGRGDRGADRGVERREQGVVRTPTRGAAGAPSGVETGQARLVGSPSAGPASTLSAVRARATSAAKTLTQSRSRQAGTTPRVGTSPRVGLSPTTPWNDAGTRPEPAVSVPRARSATPRATATADPLLDPPETYSGRRTSRTAPYGLRVPTSPVANWSRFVAPSTTHPAARSRATAGASAAGVNAKSGQAAVVGMPATSMLFFTARVRPASGRSSPAATRASTAAASASASACGRRLIQTSGRSAAARRA